MKCVAVISNHDSKTPSFLIFPSTNCLAFHSWVSQIQDLILLRFTTNGERILVMLSTHKKNQPDYKTQNQSWLIRLHLTYTLNSSNLDKNYISSFKKIYWYSVSNTKSSIKSYKQYCTRSQTIISHPSLSIGSLFMKVYCSQYYSSLLLYCSLNITFYNYTASEAKYSLPVPISKIFQKLRNNCLQLHDQ